MILLQKTAKPLKNIKARMTWQTMSKTSLKACRRAVF